MSWALNWAPNWARPNKNLLFTSLGLEDEFERWIERCSKVFMSAILCALKKLSLFRLVKKLIWALSCSLNVLLSGSASGRKACTTKLKLVNKFCTNSWEIQWVWIIFYDLCLNLAGFCSFVEDEERRVEDSQEPTTWTEPHSAMLAIWARSQFLMKRVTKN